MPWYGPPGFAVGRPAIVAVVDAVLLAPLLSVTVSEIWNVPGETKVWVGVAPVPVVLSPKFHANEVIVRPLGAVEAAPLKPTAWPTVPMYGPPGFAVGATEAGAGRISMAARFQRSLIGAVSVIWAAVPALTMGAVLALSLIHI